MPRNHRQPNVQPIIRFDAVSKSYGLGNAQTHALLKASFVIEPGSLTVITGPSGSGKSTILNLLGLLDRPTSGTIVLDGHDVSQIRSDSDRAKVRRELIGFIFQQFMLLPKATALENVVMPGIYSSRHDRLERSRELLRQVGLGHRLNHRPNQLSGGEMQRVAIARALLNEPKLILADEPTGNLDSTSGTQILKLLQGLNREGKTVIVVTHDDDIAKLANQVIKVKDGKIL